MPGEEFIENALDYYAQYPEVDLPKHAGESVGSWARRYEAWTWLQSVFEDKDGHQEAFNCRGSSSFWLWLIRRRCVVCNQRLVEANRWVMSVQGALRLTRVCPDSHYGEFQHSNSLRVFVAWAPKPLEAIDVIRDHPVSGPSYGQTCCWNHLYGMHCVPSTYIVPKARRIEVPSEDPLATKMLSDGRTLEQALSPIHPSPFLTTFVSTSIGTITVSDPVSKIQISDIRVTNPTYTYYYTCLKCGDEYTGRHI